MNNTSGKIRVLLVDDHYFVRMGLSASLAQEEDFLMLGHVASGAEALAAVADLKPDVIILDGRLPDLHGTVVAERILKKNPDLRIVMLTIGDSEEEVARAVEAGVQAFLPKSAERSEVLAAIRAVVEGNRYFPPAILNKVVEHRFRQPVSDREREVLLWVAHGLSNKEIGDRMKIAEATVKMHLGSILDKLQASDRTHAMTIAHQRGIISLDDIELKSFRRDRK